MPLSAESPPARSAQTHIRTTISDWFSRLAASDPGLLRLQSAAQATITVGIVILCEWLFTLLAHPLQVPADAPGAALLNKAATVMAIMAGAMVAMVSSFVGPMFSKLWVGVGGLFLLPATMFAGVTLALVLAAHLPLALIIMVVILGGCGFLRRFASFGFIIGQGLFMGYFLGFFLGRITGVESLGWVAIELGIGSLIAVVAHILVFHPSRWSAVQRLRTSFLGRADALARATIDLLDDPGSTRLQRQIHRRSVRLNEAALMIDAQLAASPGRPRGISAQELHQLVFSAELSLSNAARFARAIAEADLPEHTRGLVRAAMAAIRQRDPMAIDQAGAKLRSWLRETAADHPEEFQRTVPLGADVLGTLHRYTTSVTDYAQVIASFLQHRFDPYWRVYFGSSTTVEEEQFEAAVELASGWLPGSSGVSATASKEAAAQAITARLDVSVRAGIQMTAAATIAVIAGVLISPDRFYWAVLAAFVTFMGANNAAEQVRKGAFRIIGTIAGIIIGTVAAHLVGDNTGLSIAVVLGALFIGLYLMRISYAFFVAAITILVAQLYLQLAEFSIGLLELRLLETAIGAGAAVLTVVVILPLRTGRVVGIATREFVEALSNLVRPTILRLQDPEFEQDLRTASRELDAAFQALAAATAPSRARLRVPGSLGGVNEQWWFAANAAHSYARNLILDIRRCETISGPSAKAAADQFAEAGQLFMASANELSRGLNEHRTERIYTRAASRFAAVAAALDDDSRLVPRQLLLRDFQLLDGALANLAAGAGLRVSSLATGTTESQVN